MKLRNSVGVINEPTILATTTASSLIELGGAAIVQTYCLVIPDSSLMAIAVPVQQEDVHMHYVV